MIPTPMPSTSFPTTSVKIGHHTLNVARSGNGDKPALLCLHGFTDHSGCWELLAHDFADDYDVIMPDMVGHGFSSRLQGARTLNTMIAEISSLLYSLGVDECKVVGHSMGAQLAMMLAAAIPNKIQAIALEDPPWRMDPSQSGPNSNSPEIQQWIADLERYKQMSLVAVANEQKPKVNWQNTDLTMWAESRRLVDISLFGGLKWDAMRETPQTLKQVRCPIMLITGNNDQGALVTDKAITLAKSLHSTMHHLHMPDADHHIRRGAHKEVSAAIRTWFDSL